MAITVSSECLTLSPSRRSQRTASFTGRTLHFFQGLTMRENSPYTSTARGMKMELCAGDKVVQRSRVRNKRIFGVKSMIPDTAFSSEAPKYIHLPPVDLPVEVSTWSSSQGQEERERGEKKKKKADDRSSPPQFWYCFRPPYSPALRNQQCEDNNRGLTCHCCAVGASSSPFCF